MWSEEICDEVGCCGRGVWKAIEEVRKEGYEVDCGYEGNEGVEMVEEMKGGW